MAVRDNPAPAQKAGRLNGGIFSGVYRSGQTGQTVNLMALPSKVRILPRPIALIHLAWIFYAGFWGSIRMSKRIIFDLRLW
jgi:hypothetical protein